MPNPTNIYYPIVGTDYNFPFPYLSAANVKVKIDGVETAYELIAQNTVRIDNTGQTGKTLRIHRETPKDPIHTWEDGAVILGAHMNASQLQSIYIAEEAYGYAEGLAEEAKAYALNGVADAVTAAVAGAANELEEQVSDDLAAAQAAAAAAQGHANATATAVTNFQSTLEDAEALLDDAIEAANDAQSEVANFRRLFLGSYSTEPTLDPYGDPLIEGAIYFNTTEDGLRVWDGFQWSAAYFSIDIPDDVMASLVLNDSAVAGTYVKDALNTLNSSKANLAHNHAQGDITGLSSALAAKANASEVADALAEKANTDDVNTALADKASNASVAAAVADKVSTSRSIATSGLVTGGGDLSADRTLTVTRAGAGAFRTGTNDDAVLTCKTPYDAAAIVALTDASTISFNMNGGFNFDVTIAGNRTLGNPTNAKPGQTGTIYVVQDATGGRSLAFASYWKFIDGTPPSLAVTAGAVNALHYKVRTPTWIEVSLAKDVR